MVATPEPLWISTPTLYLIHRWQIDRFGGLKGVRDANVVESALYRPRNLWVYKPTIDVADLTACYFVELGRQQGFFDGNKRTSLAVSFTFLHANGYDLIRPHDEVFAMTLSVATDQIEEGQVASWIRMYMKPKGSL